MLRTVYYRRIGAFGVPMGRSTLTQAAPCIRLLARLLTGKGRRRHLATAGAAPHQPF